MDFAEDIAICNYQTLLEELRKMNQNIQSLCEDVGRTTQGFLEKLETINSRIQSLQNKPIPVPGDIITPSSTGVLLPLRPPTKYIRLKVSGSTTVRRFQRSDDNDFDSDSDSELSTSFDEESIPVRVIQRKHFVSGRSFIAPRWFPDKLSFLVTGTATAAALLCTLIVLTKSASGVSHFYVGNNKEFLSLFVSNGLFYCFLRQIIVGDAVLLNFIEILARLVYDPGGNSFVRHYILWMHLFFSFVACSPPS